MSDTSLCGQKLIRALQWRADVDIPKMIEAPAYRRDYLGFDSVAQQELDAICEAANLYYERVHSSFRIYNSMGELRPGFQPQLKLKGI